MKRIEDTPLEEAQFFVIVDEFEDHPETGELRVKGARTRTIKCCINDLEWTDQSGVRHPPQKSFCIPDQENGIYPILVSDRFGTRKLAKMKEYAEKSNGKIIGPFDSPKDAVIAKHQARPKTYREMAGTLTAENQKLVNASVEKDSELETLKERLAKFEGSRGTGGNSTPEGGANPKTE